MLYKGTHCTHLSRKTSAISGGYRPTPHCIHANLASVWHLCGWIERIPGGARQNDGLETEIMGATAAR